MIASWACGNRRNADSIACKINGNSDTSTIETSHRMFSCRRDRTRGIHGCCSSCSRLCSSMCSRHHKQYSDQMQEQVRLVSCNTTIYLSAQPKFGMRPLTESQRLLPFAAEYALALHKESLCSSTETKITHKRINRNPIHNQAINRIYLINRIQ